MADIGTGYCIKCKIVRKMTGAHMERYKNGAPVEKGKCVMCGTNISRMMSKEHVVIYEMKGSEEGDPT